MVTQPACDRADNGGLSTLPLLKSEAGELIWGRTELLTVKRWLFSWVTPQPAPRDEKAWYYASSREAVVTVQAEGPHAPLCTLRVLRPRAQPTAMQWTPRFQLCAKCGGGFGVRERRRTCVRYHFRFPGLSQKQVTVALSSVLLCFLNFLPNRDTVRVL